MDDDVAFGPRSGELPAVRLARLEEFRPDPKNANRGTDRGRDLLEASVRKYRAGRPIFVDRNGTVIGGNKTLAAAMAAGLKEAIVVPGDGSRLVIFQRDDLELGRDVAAAEIGIADNRIAELSLEWDESVIEELRAAGVSLGDLWTEEELALLLDRDGRPGLTDPDASPAPRRTSIRAGQVFQLGQHRLVCGDSTDGGLVARLLGDARPRLMTTDPPYGVNYDPKWRKLAGVNNSDRMGDVANDDRADWFEVWELFAKVGGAVAYVYHAGVVGKTVQLSLEKASFDVRAQIIWRKNRIVLSRGHYHWQHEPCFYAVRHGRSAYWTGKRNQSTDWLIVPTVHRCERCGSVAIESAPLELPSTVWDIAQKDATGETTHGTQKPVECFARAMRNHAAPVIFEPFSGSGSTIIAGQMHDRTVLACELDPVYVQMAIDRWEQFTGAKATKLGDAPRKR